MTRIIDFDTDRKNYSNFEARFFNPRNDVAFKKVFQHESLTLSFLNSTLRLKDDRQIKAVQFLPTEQLPMTAESKKSILDVLCIDHRGFRYIIEVQNKLMSTYIQRVQYYVAHLYAGQLEKTGNYLHLKPVTILSLLNHCVFPDQVKYLSFHQNIEMETQVSYLNDMSYAFIELPKFTKALDELSTTEDYWIYMMKYADDMQEVPQEAPEEVKQAYDILEKHTWTRNERLAYEQAKIGLMDDLDMVQTAWDSGREEGRQEGRQEGEQLGRAQEKESFKREKQEMAQKLLTKGMSTGEVCDMTGLTLEEITK